MTCAAEQGSSSSATATGSGSSSSKGCSVTFTMHGLSLSAGYNSATEKVDISGTGGARIDDNGADFEGSYSSEGSWATSGTGSKSGSASYTVLLDQGYEGCSSSSYTYNRNGNCTAGGNGSTESPGSMAYSAGSYVCVF